MRAKLMVAMAFVAGLLGGCASEDLLAGLPDGAVPDGAAPDAAEPTCEPIVFLNREPTAFERGEDDSVLNRSQVVMASVMTTGTDLDGATWQSVVDCAGDLLQPFGIRVTDVDPGDVDHLEVAFSMSADDIGAAMNTSSLNPFSCPATARRGVAFEFPGTWGGDARLICEDLGEIVGHFAGLDHSIQCEDMMTRMSGCGEKAFLDQEVRCGEDTARACLCTQLDTQNSFQTMTDWFGAYCD